MITSITRFDRVVNDYENYRPSYPRELIQLLQKQMGFSTIDIVADIGSGTGISSSLFIENRNVVYAVEPNDKMRIIAERKFENELHFMSINGTAENTTLREKSIDLIFCGQAFHWFDVTKTKKEFQRILKPGGHVVLAWNERDRSSAFQIAYEKILCEHIEGYKDKYEHENLEKKIQFFFEPSRGAVAAIAHSYLYDLTSLKGRLRSSSFCPERGSDSYMDLFTELEDLFYRFEENGLIGFDYETKVYTGLL